jgi:hypothetical protein
VRRKTERKGNLENGCLDPPRLLPSSSPLLLLSFLLSILPHRMVGPNPADLREPGQGGGIRLFLNGLPVSYYTGKYNGCYRSMWFRFGEYCSAQEEVGHTQSDSCSFREGKAPDDGWFENDLYPPHIPRPATPAPAPSPPTTPVPGRTGPTDAPAAVINDDRQ